MILSKYKKLFGVGPVGAIISLFSLLFLIWLSHIFPQFIMSDQIGLFSFISLIMVILGISLHIWSIWSLKNWWRENKLCTKGAFKYFRHPMYASWITFIALGITIYFNSWLFVIWYLLLHLFWHRLIWYEERIMIDKFGETYLDYCNSTRRFIPNQKIFSL